MVRMTKVMIKTGITTVQALGRNPNKPPAMTIALESCSRWPTRNEPTSTKAAPPQSVGNQKKSGSGSSRRKTSSAIPCRKKPPPTTAASTRSNELRNKADLQAIR